MNNSRRFRLGLLALLSGVTFLGLLGFVLQGALRHDRVSYFILFEDNVKGMVVGSKVNFQGVPFGMVKDIRFQNGKTMVEVSVDPTRAEIQDITRARLDRLLVTGQVTVELEGYGPEGRPLRPGQFVQPTEDPMHQLTKTLPEMVPQITSVLEKFETVLGAAERLLGPENQALATALLQNANTLTAQMAASWPQVDAVLKGSDTALAEAAVTLTELRGVQSAVVDTLREAKAVFGGLRGPAQAALTAMRGSLDELRSFARQLRMAPDSLLFGVSRPAAPAGGER